MKTVPLEPGDLILHPVNFGIVFRASQDCRVFLNRVDAFPFAGPRKGNGIPTGSSEGVDEDAPSSWCGLRDVICYFTTSRPNIDVSSQYFSSKMQYGELDVLRYRLRRDSKPGIIGQPDPFVVSGENLIALSPVTVSISYYGSDAVKRKANRILLNVPGDLSNIVVVVHLWRDLFPIISHDRRGTSVLSFNSPSHLLSCPSVVHRPCWM